MALHSRHDRPDPTFCCNPLLKAGSQLLTIVDSEIRQHAASVHTLMAVAVRLEFHLVGLYWLVLGYNPTVLDWCWIGVGVCWIGVGVLADVSANAFAAERKTSTYVVDKKRADAILVTPPPKQTPWRHFFGYLCKKTDSFNSELNS